MSPPGLAFSPVFLYISPSAEMRSEKRNLPSSQAPENRGAVFQHRKAEALIFRNRVFGAQMIRMDGVSKSYAKQALLQNVSFSLSPGERLGLVGRNGHGKSTIFRMILGEEEPDEGLVVIPKGYTVGHLSQHLVFKNPTVLDEAASSLPMHEDGFQETYKAEAMLSGLGFAIADFHVSPQELSGGFQIRLNLAKLLLKSPNLLLLDEPTNYLDIVSVRWLTKFLQDWENELIIITHDRSFMDSVTTHTMGIHRGKVRKVSGSTEKLYAQLVEEEEIYEKTRLNEEKKRKEVEAFIARFRAQASKASSVQSRVKALARQGELEKLQDISSLEFQFNSAPFPGKWVLETKGLSFGYTDDELLFSNINIAVGKEDRIGIIGKNGRGKTTLLNVIAGELEPKEGEIVRNGNTKLGYFGQTNVQRLTPNKTVEDEILEVHPDKNRTVARSICGAMMFEGDTALKKVSVLSGGEKARVLLGKILVTQTNFLLLDEPTNHLDMYSVDALRAAIEEFPGAVMIVTHSELLLSALCNRLIVFDGGEVNVFEGSYQDFLDRVGWEDERDDGASSSRRNKSKNAKKDARKERADKSKKLAPLKKKVEDLERKITWLEKEMKENQEKLLKASSSGNTQDIITLSTEASRAKTKMEQLFQDLESATAAFENAEKEFSLES